MKKLAALCIITFFSNTSYAAIICDPPGCALNPLTVGGESAEGSLTITEGDEVTSTAPNSIGAFGTFSATVTIDGPGSTLTTLGNGSDNDSLWIGSSFGDNPGSAEVTISNGGKLEHRDSPIVEDVSNGIFLGAGGTGTIDINSGGSLVMQSEGGASSSQVNQTFMNVGQVFTDTPSVGTINVDGANSSVEIYGADSLAVLNLGLSTNEEFTGTGHGELNVTNGGQVIVDGGTSAGFVSLARGGNSSGEINISGATSKMEVTGANSVVFITNDFPEALPGNGQASMTVSDGATVEIRGTDPGLPNILAVGFGTGDGVLTVESGGSVSVDGRLDVSLNSIRNETQTGLVLINGATSSITATTTTVGNGTNPDINGILAGTGTLNSDTVLVQQGGLLDPGLSPGTLTINGNVSFNGGALRMEIGGADVGSYDILKVIGGTLDLTSALIEIAFIDDFLPTLGQTWSLFQTDLGRSVEGLDSAIVSISGLSDGFLYSFGENGFQADSNGVAVPEPTTGSLLILGLFALGMIRVRKSQAMNL